MITGVQQLEESFSIARTSFRARGLRQETCLEQLELRRRQLGDNSNFFKSVGRYFDLPQQGRVHMTEEVKTVSCCPALLLVPAEAAVPEVPLSVEPIPG